MSVFKLARYVVRPEAREAAERAMHELASYVRRELPGSSWTTYRDPHAPTHYVSVLVAEDAAADATHQASPGTQAFMAALAPLADGPIEVTEYQLVTSSDLARRHRDERRPPRRRPR